MIEVRGSREEIYKAVKGIAPKYPASLIRHLELGEWHFILNEIDVLVEVVENEKP